MASAAPRPLSSPPDPPAELPRQQAAQASRHGEAEDHGDAAPDITLIVVAQVQEHDDEEEEDHDGPGVDHDLDGCQKVGLQEHEDAGDACEAGHHEHQARYGASPHHHAESAPDRYAGEYVEEQISHVYRLRTAPTS